MKCNSTRRVSPIKKGKKQKGKKKENSSKGCRIHFTLAFIFGHHLYIIKVWNPSIIIQKLKMDKRKKKQKLIIN